MTLSPFCKVVPFVLITFSMILQLGVVICVVPGEVVRMYIPYETQRPPSTQVLLGICHFWQLCITSCPDHELQATSHTSYLVCINCRPVQWRVIWVHPVRFRSAISRCATICPTRSVRPDKVSYPDYTQFRIY